MSILNQKKRNNTNHRLDITKLWLECAQRDLSNDPLVQTSLDQLFINPTDKECLEIITQKIQAEDIQNILNPEPFRKSNPEYIGGPIRLGIVKHTGAIWGISPDFLTTHLLCVGRTGGGKTTIIKHILKQLLKRK